MLFCLNLRPTSKARVMAPIKRSAKSVQQQHFLRPLRPDLLCEELRLSLVTINFSPLKKKRIAHEKKPFISSIFSTRHPQKMHLLPSEMEKTALICTHLND